MQINLNTYKDENFTCPKCGWKGKGSEFDIENFSVKHSMIDFECPKCVEHIGSGQPDLVAHKEAIEKEKAKWKFLDIVFKLLGEGGSITFYKQYDEQTASTWYYYEVSEMGYEDLDIPSTFRKSELSFTFWEALLRLKNEKPYFYNLYPECIAEEFSDDIISVLRLCHSEEYAQIDFDYWAKVIDMNIYEFRFHLEKK